MTCPTTNAFLRSASSRLPTDIRLRALRVSIEQAAFRTPLYISGRTIDCTTLARVEADVEGADGRVATGRGMATLSYMWAWPSTLTVDARDSAMRAFCLRLAEWMPTAVEDWGHPVEFGCVAHERLQPMTDAASREFSLGEDIPPLAASVCFSPIDAALHDAYGHLHGASSYDLLGPDYLPGDLARFLGAPGAGITLDRALDLRLTAQVPGCFIISRKDPLRRADVTTPIGDGLPECAEEWVLRHGFAVPKLKVDARDPREDAEWVSDVMRMMREAHAQLNHGITPWVTVDPNEGYANAEMVVAFLRILQEIDPETYRVLRYLEQPIPRALGLVTDMRPVATLKPVLADESINHLEQLDDLMRAGWSGLALKVCKSQSLCLLLAAWSHMTHRPYSVQDLTNASLAAVQSLGLAA
ncbi:MAG TPA: mandelate racemase/muconate lactonizing enzyme family protein, partial [Armatimonadota bacterium]